MFNCKTNILQWLGKWILNNISGVLIQNKRSFMGRVILMNKIRYLIQRSEISIKMIIPQWKE